MSTKWFGLARHTGEQAEQRAQAYLISQGLQAVTRNYRCKLGEIDLIMRDGELLVFVEVRFRSTSGFGTAAETVTRQKQQKIIRAAAYFLKSEGLTEQVSCRFDVVSLEGTATAATAGTTDSAGNAGATTRWFRDAFRAYN